MAPGCGKRHGTKDSSKTGGSRYGAAVLALSVLLAAFSAGAQPAPLVISRNWFHAQEHRPARALSGGGGVSLGAEQLEVSGAAHLRIASPSRAVSAALRFRPLPNEADGWVLTVVLTTQQHGRDFYYLGQGQRAEQGKLVEQGDYHADGLQTELTAEDEQGRLRSVREIVLQDDGQAELRLALEGDTLRLTALTPDQGGVTMPPRFPGGKGPPLRLLDYSLLGGGYTDNAFAELWLSGFLVLRANYFTTSSETLSVTRIAFAQQAWRWEHFSVWLEGGGAVSQRRNEKTKVTEDARVGLAAGATGHWRYDRFGASLHLGSAGTSLVTQLAAGWQFSQSWGALLSWQQVKDASGFGLGMSVNF